MTFYFYNKISQIIEDVFYKTSSTVYEIFDGLTDSYSDVIYYFKSKNKLEKENQNLISQITEYSNSLKQMSVLENENKILKEQLKVNNDNNQNYITAKVISSKINSSSVKLIISAGKNSGIRINSTVTSNGFLLGRIIDIQDDYSTIITIFDARSQISAYSDSKDKIILQGTNSIGPLKVKHMGIDSKGEEEVIVKTSPLSSLFIAGIPIGVLKKDNDDNFFVTPLVKLSRLEYVKILNI